VTGRSHRSSPLAAAAVETTTSARLPVGILLAAGRGARFGGAKLLAPIPGASHGVAAGTPVGSASALHLHAALGDVIAVVRPGDTLLHDALAATGARVIVCARADEGMGASLACGVAAAPADAGYIVALADMPWIVPATIARVAQALRDGASIAVPVHRGERGHPVGFAAWHRSALLALSGDQGARSVVEMDAAAVMAIEVDDPGVVRDVDRPADLAPSS
jgi:molybdenum cofactor cytidylyltransferase